MIGILIITHGQLGANFMSCAAHVLGESPAYLQSLSVEAQHEPEDDFQRAVTLIQALDTGAGVLILSDIYGATPCNMVAKLLKSHPVQAVAGVNLPMLLRVLGCRHKPLKMLVEEAIIGGREGVVHFNAENCHYHNEA